MQVILQFCLIAILLEEAFSSGVCYTHHQCIKLKKWDLNIPGNNPIAKGEKNDAGDNWYTYVNWLAKPTGNLTLSYKTQRANSGWEDISSGTVNVYEEGKLEKFDWAHLARKALGLNRPNVKIPGKVRVNRNLFTGDKCIGINLDTHWTEAKYRIFLVVTDDEKKLFLTGQIVKYPE